MSRRAELKNPTTANRCPCSNSVRDEKQSRRVKTLLSGLWLALLGLLLCSGCRGQTSPDPPIHPNLNMDFQDRFLSQRSSSFFSDQRAMRPEVPGTVARGHLDTEEHFARGLVDGKPAITLPLTLDRDLLLRGQERFNIFCAACHDRAGTGEGMIVKKGMVPPPRFTDERLRHMPLGQLFQIISQGIRNMPSYAVQVPRRDRWAIVAFVRALQLSGSAGFSDIPQDIIEMKGWRK